MKTGALRNLRLLAVAVNLFYAFIIIYSGVLGSVTSGNIVFAGPSLIPALIVGAAAYFISRGGRRACFVAVFMALPGLLLGMADIKADLAGWSMLVLQFSVILFSIIYFFASYRIPEEEPNPVKARTRYIAKTFVRVFIVLFLLLLVSFVLMVWPFFMEARQTAQKQECSNNIRMLESALKQWHISASVERGAIIPAGAPIDISGLLDYVRKREMPVCPRKGAYSLNAVGAEVKCSVHGGLGDLSDYTVSIKDSPGYKECMEYMKKLDAARTAWAEKEGLGFGASPKTADLEPYLKGVAEPCRTYFYRPLGFPFECSLHGEFADIPEAPARL